MRRHRYPRRWRERYELNQALRTLRAAGAFKIHFRVKAGRFIRALRRISREAEKISAALGALREAHDAH